MELTRRDMLAATALIAASAVLPQPSTALSPEFEKLNRAFGEAMDAYRTASQAHAAAVPELMKDYRQRTRGQIGWYLSQAPVAHRHRTLAAAQMALDDLLVERPRSDADRATQHAAIDLAQRELGDRFGQTRRSYAVYQQV
ncbi:MAG: hypothetical protein ACOY4O_18530 [Pseudomonadota bacterium]